MDPCLVGVDVGGTKVRIGLVHANKVRHAIEFPTPAKDKAALVRRLVEEVRNIGGAAQDVCLGVGFAGQVQGGVVRGSPNLHGWSQVRLEALLRRRLDASVVVTNDARAAAWGEHATRLGRARGNLLFLALGTGVGAGVVTGGRLMEGATGCAGELGHICVEPRGARCSCGARGCLEAYVGGWAIAREARRRARHNPSAATGLAQMTGSVRNISARTVASAWHAGDPLAVAIISDAETRLASASTSFANAINPRVIALGGGIARAFPSFRQAIQDGVALALPPARKASVVQSKLGVDAVLVGAALLAAGRKKAPGPR